LGRKLLADGNAAVALLANTGATVAALATLIAVLGPISGAQHPGHRGVVVYELVINRTGLAPL
jgi:hypothetical protein